MIALSAIINMPKTNWKKINFSLLIILLIFLVTAGLSCKLFPQSKPPQSLTQKTTLNYWGVWQNNQDLAPIIADFKLQHPNVDVVYTKFRYNEYEQKLLEAWAEDKGPDIYSLPAGWLKKYQNRITPMPSSVQLAFEETKTTLGKTETQTFVRTIPMPTLTEVKNKFVDVVGKDVILDGKVYGLPLSVDTMGVYFNRSLLDQAGIALPPTNWTEFKETVKQITKLDNKNNIVQSGTALGATQNIPRAVDIAVTLMMQNGTNLGIDTNASAIAQTSGEYNWPSVGAIGFFHDFADPLKEVYSWNASQPDALDAFVNGKVAMFFGYSYQLPIIKSRAPKMDLGVLPMMQIQGANKPIALANYWVETASHKVKNPDIAWAFINFMTAQDQVSKYLTTSGRPTALRALISGQKQDPLLAPFVEQILSAKRWYYGRDELRAENLILEMIKRIPEIADPRALSEYLNQMVQQINQTY